MKTSTINESHVIFDYGKKKVPFENISHFKSEFGNYTKVFLKEKKVLLTAFTLKHYSDQLSENHTFMILRKGLIINKTFVDKMDQDKEGVYITLKSGERFKVSRRREDEIVRRLV